MDILANSFGQVTPDRVTFNLRKGWFSGVLRSDYPTKHITSVAFDVSRRPVAGVICAGLGLWALFSGAGFGTVVLGVLLLLLAVYFLWGRPAIHFATAGGERIISLGQWPWQKDEALAFVESLKNEIFKSGAKQ